jgi:hypothetical protein
MKTIFKTFTVLAFIFLSHLSFSQQISVKGNVFDTTGKQSLSNALVMVVRINDSLLINFTRTAEDGSFILNQLPVDTFQMVISHPRFDEKKVFIFGEKDNPNIDLGTIKMPNRSKALDEIMIYANRNPIFYKGDTLVYVADSFAVAEGAVVEDLLKKLPGIKVDKDGKITSQGQAIDKVLVDGDEFFGTDPTIATKNLAADGVETVQIYKQKDSETIGGSENEQNILDLKLKEEAKKGYFGRVSGASDLALTPLDNYFGSRPFYEGELLFNKFTNKQKISVFVLGSNTPRSNFGRGDLNKFGLSNESGANGNFWEPDNKKTTSGVPQTLKAGIYYSDKLGKNKKTEVLFNYSYYNDRLDARSASKSQYFLADTTYFTDDSTRNYSRNESHNINFTLSSQLDSLTLLEIKPSVRVENGLNESSDISIFTGENGFESLSTSVINNNISDGLKINNTARIYRKFKKKRRELEVRYDLNMNKTNSNGFLYTLSKYSLLPADTIDQWKSNSNASTSHYGTVSYIEPLSKKWKINVNYLFEYGIANQDKATYDGGSGIYTVLREDLSNNFDNNRIQNRAGAELIYEKFKHYFSFGSFVRNIQIDNVNLVSGAIVNQNINDILPKFKYEFKPSMSKRFSVNYITSSQQPTINDLQPIPDNSNPNRIQEGNPDLKPNYVHQFNVNFNTWNALSGKYIWSGASVNLINDAFASEVSFDNFGRTVSKTINVDGNLSAYGWVGGGLPILDQKIEFQPSVEASFVRTKNRVGGIDNVTDNFSIAPSLEIDFEWDSLEIQLSGEISYNNPMSSLSTVSNTPFTSQNYFLSVKWRLPLGFIIESEADFTKNSQKGEGFYDFQFFVWNAELSKKFLKTQNLTVSIIGNDLLNQNVNAQREVIGNIVRDYRTTIISRYFLLKVNYRFNNRKTKEDDFKGWH